MVPFSFADQEFALAGERALYWPREQALVVADLHLEKASFYASTGQMLPPYDSRETLERVAATIRQTGARRVFTLGDNFHDAQGPDRLEPHAAGMLDALTRAVDWVWIAGNHDGDEARAPGGTVLEDIEISGIMLRHMALAGACGPELSGHFHPRLSVIARGRRITRHCAVRSEHRMILPAFGALTGGMNAADQAILDALQPARAIDAVLSASGRLLSFPLWRSAA